ncbi:MAG: 30S ribosome-binding factor RbfA [Clostridia bacterium]|nr:30S ribosome-binding factor RbfA [Clostridia bacterium]
MPATRADRVAERIREEMADILRRRVKDPRLGFVSVTQVRVSPDLRHARVYVSVLGGEEERRASERALASAKGFIQSELGARLGLFRTPLLEFRLDDSIERGVRVSKLLDEAEAGRGEAGDA